MALSNVNVLSESAYFSLLYDMIKPRENARLLAGTGDQRIHDGGGDGNPTFGYGFNLAAFSASVVEQVITHAYSGSLTSAQQDGLDLVLAWKNGTSISINGGFRALTNADIIDMADPSGNGVPGAVGSSAQRSAVQSLFLNDAQATRILDVLIKGDLGLVRIEGPTGSFGYEDGLDFRLADDGIVPFSTERAALLSLYYNATSLIGPGVQNAIATDNRPQLWYEIRYNHGNFDFLGLQNRRAEESDLLGLVSQRAKDDPLAFLDEYALAIHTLLNDDDRLGRRLLTRMLDRDALDPFYDAIAEEMEVLNTYYAQTPLGDPDAPAIDFVQYDANDESATIIASDEAAAGVAGGKDEANTVNLILGNGGADTILGLGGADYLYGGADGDLIDGGEGDDAGFGGDGDDTLMGSFGDDTLIGNRGADELYGDAGVDRLLGGDGDDTLRGGAGNDSLGGEAGADYHYGEGGDDFARGRGAFDTLYGGDGNDTLIGDAGWDLLFGEAGADLLQGGIGSDTLRGGDGNDTLLGENAHDKIFSNQGDDVARGGSGNDFVFGGFGNDRVEGNAGNDRVNGEGGDDDVYGGPGNDTLLGRAGTDTLFGGAGDDVFIFEPGEGVDVIRDFKTGAGSEDVIDLSAFGADFDSFAEVFAVARQNGPNTAIDFGDGDLISLWNTNVSSLDADDFFFG